MNKISIVDALMICIMLALMLIITIVRQEVNLYFALSLTLIITIYLYVAKLKYYAKDEDIDVWEVTVDPFTIKPKESE